jgi:hypothetical protein
VSIASTGRRRRRRHTAGPASASAASAGECKRAPLTWSLPFAAAAVSVRPLRPGCPSHSALSHRTLT